MGEEQEAGMPNKPGLNPPAFPDFILAMPSSPAWQTAGHDDESSRLEPGSPSSDSGSGTQSMCTFDSGQVSYLYSVWCW